MDLGSGRLAEPGGWAGALRAPAREAGLVSDAPLEERRRVARLLRELAREIVSADVEDAELAPVGDALVGLRDRLAGEPRLVRDDGGMLTTTDTGKRFGREPAYDRDPLIGLSNPLAPPLRRVEGGEEAEWEVEFGEAYEGHPGFVHGGYVAAVLDHVLGVAAAGGGVATMTGTLTTRYRRPTPTRTRLVCRGQRTHLEGRKVYCRATLEAGGEVVAEGEGIFLRVAPDRYGGGR